MTNILLPTDFSENAWNAVEYALQLFKDEPCTFYILNAFDQPGSDGYMGVTSAMAKESIYNAQVTGSKEGLRDVLDKVTKTYTNPNHKFKCLSIFKNFTGAIKKVTEDYDIQLIVMGSKGAGSKNEITVGSNTSSLIGSINCPMIAVPHQAKYKVIQEIGLSTDYDITFTEKGLKPLLHLAKTNASSIAVLHVMDRVKDFTANQKEKIEALKGVLDGIPSNYFTLTDIGIATGVRAFAQSRKLDLLCVVTKEKDFLKRILNQSYSKSISNHSNIPLLILNIKNF